MRVFVFLILFLSVLATAKESVVLDIPPPESCEAPLIVSPDNIFLRHNDLIITNDNQVFWHGKSVQLKLHAGTFEKTSRVLLQVLVILVENSYEPVEAEKIPVKDVSDAISEIRRCFKQVDENFNAAKNYQEAIAKFVWDDGKSDARVEGVADLQLTRFEAKWKDKTVAVSDGQRRMIRLLVEKVGTPVSNRDLFRAFIGWPSPEMNDRVYVEKTVNWHLTRVRKAFREFDSDFDRIVKSYRQAKKWRLD